MENKPQQNVLDFAKELEALCAKHSVSLKIGSKPEIQIVSTLRETPVVTPEKV